MYYLNKCIVIDYIEETNRVPIQYCAERESSSFFQFAMICPFVRPAHCQFLPYSQQIPKDKSVVIIITTDVQKSYVTATKAIRKRSQFLFLCEQVLLGNYLMRGIILYGLYLK